MSNLIISWLNFGREAVKSRINGESGLKEFRVQDKGDM